MVSLYICEKQSLAEALAGELGLPVKKNGYYEVGSDYVAWLKGHIMTWAEPDFYDAKWARKNNSYNVLPILPNNFKKLIKTKVGKSETKSYQFIFDIIKKLAGKSDIVVNVGDPDKEGQELVDEVIEELKWNKTEKRLLINAYDSITIKRALENIEDNKAPKYRRISSSATCRSITDWLIGMNGSRKFSLDAGTNVAVGRVKMPILSLIARRNEQIDNFIPVKHYIIKAYLTKESKTFSVNWKAKEVENGLDEEGRLIDVIKARDILNRITGKTMTVESISKKRKQNNPPLPFSLSTLQKEACPALKITLKELDEVLQELYEKKLTTYPRTDARVLSTAVAKEIKKNLIIINLILFKI